MAVALNAHAKTTHTRTKTAPVPPRTGAQQLVRRCRAVLGVLAALSVVGQIGLQSALQMPQESTKVTETLAGQQALGQHLVLSALAVQSAETPATRAVWEDDLRGTAERWARAEKALPRSTHLSAAEESQAAMLDAAHGLLAALPPETSAERVHLQLYLTTLMQSQAAYQQSMDRAVAASQQQAAAQWTVTRALIGGGLALTLLALAALAALPDYGATRRTFMALDDLEEQAVGQSAALGEADRKIAEMQATLENLSAVDALTGLKNHRTFHEELEREMGRAQRHGQPLSLLLLDLDRFKSYNDSYGHAQGDRALQMVSDVLKESGRVSDIPARFGGEEFALILTETDMMGAVVLGERLRQAVASADGLSRPLTASIGIATLAPHISGAASLIAQADRALCHAKGDGRNRVSHAHRIPAPLEDEPPVYAQAA